MKIILKTILLLLATITLFNCDNDDGSTPNDTFCSFSGLTVEDNNGNISTQIPEANLQTDYFPNNDGPGLAAVEVWDTTNPGDTFIVTRALTIGAVDNAPEIKINNVDYTGVVTCQRASTVVGGELRFDVVVTGLGEAELCVIIDNVTP